MTVPNPAVVDFAKSLGIDLINGEHDGHVAEAARRANLELLHFPDWHRDQVAALMDSLKRLAEEEQRGLQQHRQVMHAMEEHGADTLGDVPRPVLAGIYGCSEDDLNQVVAEHLSAPWWYQ